MAAQAARRQAASQKSKRSIDSTSSAEAKLPQGAKERYEEAAARRLAQPRTRKRSSLSSLQGFVPATLPIPEASNEGMSSVASSVASGSSKLSLRDRMLQRQSSYRSTATRDSYAAEEVDTVYIDRVVVGPMDMTSPNRKGSTLAMRAVPNEGQLTVGWKEERKVVLNLAFDSITAVQLPGPDCDYTFVILKVATGQVKEILFELDQTQLLHFQRFVLFFIAGTGADFEHLS